MLPASTGPPTQRRKLATGNWCRYCGQQASRRSQRAQHRRLTLYTLRHTHATMLLSAGLNPKVVSERLGHTGIAMTLTNYTHVLPSMQELAADQFERTVWQEEPGRYSGGTQGQVCPCCGHSLEQSKNPAVMGFLRGGRGRARTADPLLVRQVL